jgi:hypothetical protein
MKNSTVALNTQPIKAGFIDKVPPRRRVLPTGPLGPGKEGREGSLLIFVPRNTISTLLDKLTGGYGYSHLAIDCGEIDIPTGKRIMIESTPGLGVHNAFQDEYGEREFIRIPLKKVGVQIDEFCDCIRSKLGEPYDNGEALSFGLITNPAKQICSDLATVCLPQEMRIDIARHHQAGFLHPFSTVRTYGRLDKTFRMFVSPNGFCQYFGAPRGRKVTTPDQLIEPVISREEVLVRQKPIYWLIGITILCSPAFSWAFAKLNRRTARKP